MAATGAGLAVLVNVLFMQSGHHPAPLFGTSTKAAKAMALVERIPMPPSRPPNADANHVLPSPAGRTPGEIITDMQRELLRRGYYDGPVDGFYGPKTDAAIREFEQTAGLKASPEPTEMLLQTMRQVPATLTKAMPGQLPPPATTDVGQERTAPSTRVVAVQRALSEYGYGQIRPTGVIDADTQRAIEKFERDRNLPVTRQYSERLARELAALTGRVLD
jgi:peptidoglycan hydrolase-like protein with peptidoglycan-binding domain